MPLNYINKIKVKSFRLKVFIVVTFSIISFSCSTIKNNFMINKYNWYATAIAPKTYPMEIMYGNFILENDESVGVGGAGILYTEWGDLGSISIGGDKFKALPKQLEITWFSFTEKKFFSGTCNLPIDNINKLFEEGFISPLTDKKATFRYITLGIAPNGKVVVWAYGDRITQEICLLSFTEDKTVKWEKFMPNPDYQMEEYVNTLLDEVLTEQDSINLKKNGVDTSLYIEKYRKHFLWSPKIVGSIKPLNSMYYYYNGESEFNFNNSEAEVNRPVPNRIKIKWFDTKGEKFSSDILFDEGEVFSAFDSLSGEHKSGKIQMQFTISDYTQDIEIILRNDTYLYTFKKCEIDVYGK